MLSERLLDTPMFKWYVINDAYISLLSQAFFERLLIFEIPSAGTDLNAPSPEIVMGRFFRPFWGDFRLNASGTVSAEAIEPKFRSCRDEKYVMHCE